MTKIEAITFETAIGRLQKALYLRNMNRFKKSVKEETKEKHTQQVIEAAKLVGSWNDID